MLKEYNHKKMLEHIEEVRKRVAERKKSKRQQELPNINKYD